MIEIEKLDEWVWVDEFDYIYIIPTQKKNDEGYKLAYYLWQVWKEIKIIELHDAGGFLKYGWCSSLNWDFESVYWWIRLWTGKWKTWKLKYEWLWWITN